MSHTLSAIEKKLTDKFNPVKLELKDDSHTHADHADQPLPSHVYILIVAEVFSGCSKIMRQRMVQELLAAEFATIHSISLKILSPDEC
jgi:BolA protein